MNLSVATDEIPVLDPSLADPWRLPLAATAPLALRRAVIKEADPAAVWRLWQVYLSGRNSRQLPWKIRARVAKSAPRAAKKSPRNSTAAPAPLSWGLAGHLRAEAAADLELLQGWLKRGVEDRTIDEFVAHLRQLSNVEPERWGIAALALAHLLPELAQRLSGVAWLKLLNSACEAVALAETRFVNVSSWAGQLLRGELPLTLAYLFPELTPCSDLLPIARNQLEIGVEEVFDGEGILHAREWPHLRPLLACWTRCRTLGERLPGRCWSSTAEKQYRLFVKECLRFSRPDGGAVFAEPGAVDDASLWQSALALVPTAARVAKATRSHRPLPPPPFTKSFRPALTSEWAQVAQLRRTWSGVSERISVLYPNRKFCTEFSAGRDVLWSGEWTCELRIDDVAVQPEGEWEEVCWFSDKDLDYLELELSLTNGWKLQRQLLLGRQDPFAYLADAVFGEVAADIEYVGTLPLGPAVKFQPAKETTEAVLAGRHTRALVMPLALPEWRSQPRLGTLEGQAGQLRLAQRARGRALYAPLWIDLNQRRLGQPCTWRQLTIGEQRQIQPRDVAAGFRVQIGAAQWLAYRSFQQPSNRTLLGQNTVSEFLIGRFTKQGTVESLVEIE